MFNINQSELAASIANAFNMINTINNWAINYAWEIGNTNYSEQGQPEPSMPTIMPNGSLPAFPPAPPSLDVGNLPALPPAPPSMPNGSLPEFPPAPPEQPSPDVGNLPAFPPAPPEQPNPDVDNLPAFPPAPPEQPNPVDTLPEFPPAPPEQPNPVDTLPEFPPAPPEQPNPDVDNLPAFPPAPPEQPNPDVGNLPAFPPAPPEQPNPDVGNLPELPSGQPSSSNGVVIIDSNNVPSAPQPEPGASIATAFDLNMHDNAGDTKAYDVTGTLDRNDDNDYFKFVFEQDVTGTLDLTNLDGDVDLGLYNGQGEMINYVWAWGNVDLHMDTNFNGEELIFNAGETYYIQVYSWDKLDTGYNLFAEFNSIA